MPVCMHCKTQNPKAFRDIQSKLLLDLIDRIQVGHKCSRNGDVIIITIYDLKRHIESGNCPGYSLKCFCGALDKFSIVTLKEHLKKVCPLVRLQCKYCHSKDNYPEVFYDADIINHFNDHSFTREAFKDHSCFKEQRKIDNHMSDRSTYAIIKMLLLQNSKPI